MPSTKCYQCGEAGHFQYACPKGQDGNRATAKLAKARGRGRSRERSRERGQGRYTAEELEKAAEIVEFQRQQLQQQRQQEKKQEDSD